MSVSRCILGLLALSALAAGQPSAEINVLKSVRATEQSGQTQIVLQLDGPVRYEPHILRAPDRFYIDLFDTSTSSRRAPIRKEGSRSLIGEIRIGTLQIGVTRLVVELTSHAEFSISNNAVTGELTVQLRPSEAPTPAPVTRDNNPRPSLNTVLREVRVQQSLSQAEIVFQFTGTARYDPHILTNPDRFYVDLPNSTTSLRAVDIPLSEPHSLVTQVRIGALPGKDLRVVLDLTRPLDFTAVFDRGSNQLRISLATLPVPTSSQPTIVPLPESTKPIPPPTTNPIEGSPSISVLVPIPPPVGTTESIVPILRTEEAVIAPIPTVPTTLGAGKDAPEPSTRSLTITRAARHPGLDEFLAGPAPEGYTRISGFRQREPGDGLPVSLGTSAYLSYDDKNLYVVFVCLDERSQIRGRMSKREDISDDDRVTLYLDPYHDSQRAYYFTVNPLGIQGDGFVFGGKTDNRFDTLWFSDGRLFDQGYAVSMTIPFKSLRFLNAEEQTWGIALGRSIVRKNENSFWPYVTRRQSNFLRQLGDAAGIRSISAGRNIQLIPYSAFSNSTSANGSPGQYLSDREARGGLDAKIVLRESLSLDLTVNPDFSQVESDDPQVTANRRFEVFFPEKRPFFIENINYFETPMNLLFTRRIADPQFGARLTGKLGRWNIGGLAIDDRAPGRLAAPGNPLFGQRSITGAARIQRVFRQDSNFGFLATERQLGDTFNRVQSADLRLRLTPTLYFSGQAAHSSDRSLNSASKLIDNSGNAYFADLSYGNRNFSYDATYKEFGTGFRAPVGFVQRVGIRSTNQYAGYFFWGDGGALLSHGPSANVTWTWDRAGRLLDRYTTLAYQMDFSGPAGFTLGYNDAYEYYLGQAFRSHTTTGSFYANWFKAFTFYGGFGLGTGVNYSTPDGVAPFLGNTQSSSFGFTWRPTQRFRVEQYHYFSRLAAPPGFANSQGIAAVNNQLSRTKVNLQFTKALSIRTIVDYYFLAPNSALFASDRYKQLTGDFLLTYLLHPGTAVYLGYNNRYENLTLDPDTPAELRRYGSPSYMTGRQIFVKLSYLFRF